MSFNFEHSIPYHSIPALLKTFFFFICKILSGIVNSVSTDQNAPSQFASAILSENGVHKF